MNSTQELIMHLFGRRKPSQKDINYKNNNLLLNHKTNIFQQNLTNRVKYKTSKNSPESRSQFIFVRDEKDIVLHGGYNISRKNHPKRKIITTVFYSI